MSARDRGGCRSWVLQSSNLRAVAGPSLNLPATQHARTGAGVRTYSGTYALTPPARGTPPCAPTRPWAATGTGTLGRSSRNDVLGSREAKCVISTAEPSQVRARLLGLGFGLAHCRAAPLSTTPPLRTHLESRPGGAWTSTSRTTSSHSGDRTREGKDRDGRRARGSGAGRGAGTTRTYN